MSEAVYVLGVHTTAFGRLPDKTFKDLTREAYLGVLRDAGLESGDELSSAWFGNCFMAHWGQTSLRGNVCFIPLVRAGLFPGRAPIINVEGACASASLALAGAYKEIKSGDANLVLAMGVEKLYDPVASNEILRLLGTGMDLFDPEEWRDYYSKVASYVGLPFEPSRDRSIAMDIYAMQALLHSKQYGTTVEQIAHAAAKNHTHGSLNPNAQYRFPMTVEQVLSDRCVSHPLTRAMCAPIGDGAAAALLCSQSYLDRQDAAVQQRAVLVRGIGLAGGKYRSYDEPGLSRAAADEAYQMAGLSPRDVQVAEVHDATSFCEIYQCEMLRFCPPGEGGKFVASGATTLGGDLPVNTSGGLIAKGHPVGATGLSMCYELVTQLRGEADQRQVEGARIALQENGGGIIGLEEALAVVLIYERAS
jgi:acetyl-CoA acetyltransferase